MKNKKYYELTKSLNNVVENVNRSYFADIYKARVYHYNLNDAISEHILDISSKKHSCLFIKLSFRLIENHTYFYFLYNYIHNSFPSSCMHIIKYNTKELNPFNLEIKLNDKDITFLSNKNKPFDLVEDKTIINMNCEFAEIFVVLKNLQEYGLFNLCNLTFNYDYDEKNTILSISSSWINKNIAAEIKSLNKF